MWAGVNIDVDWLQFSSESSNAFPRTFRQVRRRIDAQGLLYTLYGMFGQSHPWLTVGLRLALEPGGSYQLIISS